MDRRFSTIRNSLNYSPNWARYIVKGPSTKFYSLKISSPQYTVYEALVRQEKADNTRNF